MLIHHGVALEFFCASTGIFNRLPLCVEFFSWIIIIYNDPYFYYQRINIFATDMKQESVNPINAKVFGFIFTFIHFCVYSCLCLLMICTFHSCC